MTARNTTAAKPARNSKVLKQRIERFLVAPKYGSDATNVVDRLSNLGRVAVFGGALRELALHGKAAHPADIDLVIECDGDQNLGDFLAPYQPQRNRFGGFRFRSERWSFDVWRVQDTWAVREGLVRAQSLDDLVRTTFFDWDALLYVHRSSSVTALPLYFERLASRVVDINLPENPNPLGNLVRALRILVLGRALLGSQLMAFVWDQLGRFDGPAILAAESSSFPDHYLSMESLVDARARVGSALERGESAVGGFFPVQLELEAFEQRRSSASMRSS